MLQEISRFMNDILSIDCPESQIDVHIEGIPSRNQEWNHTQFKLWQAQYALLSSDSGHNPLLNDSHPHHPKPISDETLEQQTLQSFHKLKVFSHYLMTLYLCRALISTQLYYLVSWFFTSIQMCLSSIRCCSVYWNTIMYEQQTCIYLCSSTKEVCYQIIFTTF